MTAVTTENITKRTLTGVVTSDKMDKTVTVLVERAVKHPVLGKMVRRSKKYHAHSPTNEIKTGDTVMIVETKPMSKTKAWAVSKLLEKAKVE